MPKPQLEPLVGAEVLRSHVDAVYNDEDVVNSNSKDHERQDRMEYRILLSDC